MSWTKLIIDIEANNLLVPLLNFTKMPYRLKDEAKVWCTVIRDVQTQQAVLLLPKEYLNFSAPTYVKNYYSVLNISYHEIEDDLESPLIHEIKEVLIYSDFFTIINGVETLVNTETTKYFKPDLELVMKQEIVKAGVLFNDLPKRELNKESFQRIFQNCEELIGHNIVNYDLPMMQLYGLLNYNIGWPGQESTLNGKTCKITDTLIWSKLLNPDRFDSFGKHSLGAWGLRLGFPKEDFHEFDKWSWRMCTYCSNDTLVSLKLYFQLLSEKEVDKIDWDTAYGMEIKLVDLTLKQEVFGFYFNKDLANWCITDLTEKLEERAALVEPSLPAKSLNKTQTKLYSPPAKQLLKNGELNSYIKKFAETNNAEIVTLAREDDPSASDFYFNFQNKSLKIPFTEPIIDSLPTNIKDHDEVKGYLLSLGWEPTEWNERDLTKNVKKQTLIPEKVLSTIKRYVENTKGSFYEKHRLDFINCSSIDRLEKFLLDSYKRNPRKALKVYTSPKLRVGAEKILCPNLENIDRDKDFVKAIVEWHTYTHRKNSISGGVDDETGEPTKGYLSQFRSEDNRIATPADTLGASTFRYRHIGVCNIPRVSSIYGNHMRGLFGCGPGLAQLGFDFASLEARIQAHYVYDYTDGIELGKQLLAEKPNSIHCVNSRKLNISRDNAKSVSYALLYGAAAGKLQKMLGLTPKEAETMYDAYWDAVPALKELRDILTNYWEATERDHIPAIDGRKLRARSPHSLVNLLFQGAGAIMAKWSLVFIAQKLEQQGLLGDPFKNTTDEVKVWQMIAYHDEVQYAIHRSLLKVKSFFDVEKQSIYEKDIEAWKLAGSIKKDKPENPFELEAIEWMENNPTKGQYSDIGHTEQGVHYITLPNIVSDIIVEGIDQAVDKFKLNVPLGVSWITGNTWAQCH